MEERNPKDLSIESSFDIDEVSFKNVSRDFESKFKEKYKNSLTMMSDSRDRLTNASGASSLGILEKMAQQISYYDSNSDFEKSYKALTKEYESFTET